MINKHASLILSLLFITISAFSQVEEKLPSEKEEQKVKLPFRERIVFGADFGLSFGSFTYIKLAPTVGYRITNRLTAGLGPIYIYARDKYYDVESSIYGIKTYASFTIYQGTQKENRFGIGDLMVHVENEVVNVDKFPTTDRLWIDNLLLGGGLYQTLGGRLGVSIFVLWDVTQNFYSPYYMQNPVFKFGLNF
ncbi:MAG TPA: hypothetical protein VHI78_04085 [Bacteroidales bacterium]|jgi:hypothetical protein|nr:hypothetical protein [Bacteroidales bacterium]